MNNGNSPELSPSIQRKLNDQLNAFHAAPDSCRLEALEQAMRHTCGIVGLTKTVAADRLYGAAVSRGLVQEIGEDAIQIVLARGANDPISEDDELEVALAARDAAPRHDAKTAALISRCAARIEPERIEWLWPGRLARGKHACIAGEPGTGKSQLSIAIIATVTTGGEWPCGEGRAQIGNVIILSAEDGAADTIVPRLLAAHADLRRVYIVSAIRNADGSRRALNLQHDLALLEKKVLEIGNVVLVIIDPVSSYLGKTDSHKNSEVRGVLEPLSEMAERTRIAILSVTHFSKGGANSTTKALHRFIGSIAFTGAPRTAFAVVEDAEQEGRMLFLHAKNNLARAPQGLAYRPEQCIVGDNIIASRIVWDSEPVTVTANQALAADAAGTESRTDKAEASEFLRTALADGPMAAAEITRAARDHGLTPKVLRTAREALGVVIERDGFGPGSKSLWSLPRAT